MINEQNVNKRKKSQNYTKIEKNIHVIGKNTDIRYTEINDKMEDIVYEVFISCYTVL